MAILGDSNTGKTYSWSFYERPDEVFSISPTAKVEQLGRMAVKGFKPQELNISLRGMSMSETAKTLISGLKDSTGKPRDPSFADLIYHLLYTDKSLVGSSDLVVTGHNRMASRLQSVAMLKQFVSLYMPEKKIILTHDFSHYINYIVASNEFRAQKSGDQAFARFWTLAADALGNVFQAADTMPAHMVDVTEFHIQLDPEMNKYDIFTTAGKMLQEKFKGKSYFDVALFASVVPFEDEPRQSERFKFVAIQKDYYDGRDMGLFSDLMDRKGEIPNYKITEIMDRVLSYIS